MLVKAYKATHKGKRMTIICTNNETRAEVKDCIKKKFGEKARLDK